MASALTRRRREAPTAVAVDLPEMISVGQWFWYHTTRGHGEDAREVRRLGCAIYVGSNYVQIGFPLPPDAHRTSDSVRVHLEHMHESCTFEPNAPTVIAGRTAECRRRVRVLLGKIREETQRLGVGHQPGLAQGSSTALAPVGLGQSSEDYSKALALSAKETLPKLFERVKKQNAEVARWMSAEVLPMQAAANGLTRIVGRIQDKILAVSLYAGLKEQIVECQGGEPAPLAEPVRVMQRMHFMDEECLAQYEAGGMDYKGVAQFDAWLCRPDNLARLLPFPRTVIAFRIRRNRKDRVASSLIQAWCNIQEEALDKYTFLYVRNGERVARVFAEIDFGEQLFPDAERSRLTGKCWYECREKKIVCDDEYQAMLREREEAHAAWEIESATYKIYNQKQEDRRKTKSAGKPDPYPDIEHVSWPGSEPRLRDAFESWHPFDKSSVYYDDACEAVARGMLEHNRVVLVLQGLLDRSMVLHPHPPWQLYDPEHFKQALELIFDSSRVLVAGEAPDFESYRAAKNKTIAVGTATVGQRAAWRSACAEYRGDRDSEKPVWARDSGGGCPRHARVVAVSRKGMLTYAWTREVYSRSDGKWKEVRVTWECPAAEVLNADAYERGDFRPFFADPRTRANYLRWAPLLLEAEEYKAGNREVPEPPPAKPRPPPTRAGRAAYQERKEWMALHGNLVRLVRDITTRGGDHYKAGALCEATWGGREGFSVTILDEETGERCGSVSGLSLLDLHLVACPIPKEKET